MDVNDTATNRVESDLSSDGESSPLLRVESVDAYYGQAQALFDVTFQLEKGAASAVIGPNGAGKTTLVDCITGFKDFDGTIAYRDISVASVNPWDVGGDEIGYCTEKGNLFDDLSVLQNLRLGGYVAQDELDQNLERVFDLFPRLKDRQSQYARTLSGGEQRMLTIGQALMADPNLLILDEPSLGLAPTIIKDIRNSLEEIISSGKTVLITEQNVNLALDLADEIHLLENGKITSSGTPSELEQDDRISQSYFG